MSILALLVMVPAAVVPPPVVPPPPIQIIEVQPPGPWVKIAKAPEPLVSLHLYFTPADYPAAALETRQQGKVGMVLQISPQGRVVGCSVTQSSGHALLDAVSCRVLVLRSRWSPALDEKGNKVFGFYSHDVTWKLGR